MKNEIKFYRIIINIFFYISYTFLVSIIFSFVFPTILIAFWQEVWLPTDPRFANIQIWILILVFILTLTLRKYFYLPITVQSNIKNVKVKKEVKKKITNDKKKIKEEKKDNWSGLDIKIGKEIK